MSDESRLKIKGRVVVLGLDGATFDLLDPLLSKGYMPNLKKLIDTGVRGELRTVVPPVTPAAWSTFITGKNPGKHGVLEFIVKSADGETPVNSRVRHGKTIWKLVNEAGGKTVVMSIPTTYPPDRVDGFMVSSFLTPRGKKDYGYPPEVIADVENKFGPYKLYVKEVYSSGRIEKVFGDAEEDIRYKSEAARYLADKIDWKLFVLHYFGTDRLQHELWHLIDPANPLYNKRESELYEDRFYRFYEKLDAELGRFIEKLRPDDTVFVMSDHGFGPVRRFMNFNVWLMNMGYLKLKKNPITKFRKFLFDIGFVPKNIYRLFMIIGLARIRFAMSVSDRKSFFSKVNKFFLSMNDVDWSRTVAYSKGYYGQIFINLNGREACGIVDPGDYESVRENIVKGIREITDPENGKKIIGPIYKPGDIYHGPYTKYAPDITFLPEDMSYKAIGTTDFTSNLFFEKTYATGGDHRMNGIFIGNGPSIKPANVISGAWIGDIAPTILYSLGLPIPDDMDGKVLTDIFTEDVLKNRKIEYARVNPELETQSDSGYTKEEKESITRSLKDLGYL